VDECPEFVGVEVLGDCQVLGAELISVHGVDAGLSVGLLAGFAVAHAPADLA
jgi:hypothetical protein